MTRFENKSVVVTGGETGIGRAITEAFAREGARVWIGGQLEAEADKVIASLGEHAASVTFLKTDVSRSDDVDRLITAAVEAGGLDVLVNNAGVYDGFAGALETSEALWSRLIDINLKGQFLTSKRALQEMVPQGAGKIVNMASVGGMIGKADGASYTASKFGIIGLTKQLAANYAEKSINVNAVCPGVIATEIRRNSATILGDAAPDMETGVGSSDGYKAMVPAKRKGLPEEIAAMVLFLASDEAAYVNGQAIAVDGGWTA